MAKTEGIRSHDNVHDAKSIFTTTTVYLYLRLHRFRTNIMPVNVTPQHVSTFTVSLNKVESLDGAERTTSSGQSLRHQTLVALRPARKVPTWRFATASPDLHRCGQYHEDIDSMLRPGPTCKRLLPRMAGAIRFISCFVNTPSMFTKSPENLSWPSQRRRPGALAGAPNAHPSSHSTLPHTGYALPGSLSQRAR